MKDRDTNASKRYAFVTYEDPEDGAKALKELHGSMVDGCRIAIERSHQGVPELARDSKRDRSRSRSPPPRDRSESPALKRVKEEGGESVADQPLSRLVSWLGFGEERVGTIVRL